jgi:hypothetical protein
MWELLLNYNYKFFVADIEYLLLILEKNWSYLRKQSNINFRFVSIETHHPLLDFNEIEKKKRQNYAQSSSWKKKMYFYFNIIKRLEK